MSNFGKTVYLKNFLVCHFRYWAAQLADPANFLHNYSIWKLQYLLLLPGQLPVQPTPDHHRILHRWSTVGGMQSTCRCHTCQAWPSSGPSGRGSTCHILLAWTLCHCLMIQLGRPGSRKQNTVMTWYPDKSGYRIGNLTCNRTRYSYSISVSGYRTI